MTKIVKRSGGEVLRTDAKAHDGKTIATFIAMYPKLNTKKSYRAAIYDFLDHIYGHARARGKILGRTDEIRRTFYALTRPSKLFEEIRNEVLSGCRCIRKD